jgi:hypothetical protein
MLYTVPMFCSRGILDILLLSYFIDVVLSIWIGTVTLTLSDIGVKYCVISPL